MLSKNDLKDVVFDAIRPKGGRASIVEVAEIIWRDHGDELSKSGPLFFTWQYDMRWAATALRRDGKLAAEASSQRGVWELKP